MPGPSVEVHCVKQVPEWILVLGGAGIVCGLAIFGYKIMRVLGVKAVKVTNARGFCLELSTAITVVTASRFGALGQRGIHIVQ